MLDVRLQSGLVVTPGGAVHADVGFADGTIAELATPGRGSAAARVVDVQGKIVLPGLFDPHLHFGLGDVQGDDTMVEDFRVSSRDCAIGGVTTIGSTTLIGTDSLVDLYRRAQVCADGKSWANYRFSCVVNTEAQIGEIPEVMGLGCRSFKLFTGYVGEQAASFGMNQSGITPEIFLRACEAVRASGRPGYVKLHAEEPYVRGLLVDRLRGTGREDLLTAWAESSPEWAESAQVYTYGYVAREAGVTMYPVHVSAGATVDTIARMQGEGTEIVGETLSIYLCTTAQELDARGVGGKAKNQPPVRFEGDRARLWQGVREGTISVVGSDSGTYSSHAKEAHDFWDCRVGINLQAADMLSLLYHHGVCRGEIDLQKLAEITSANAVRLEGLYPAKGAIAVGSDADVVVFDPEAEVHLGRSRYRGANDYSIWEGQVLRGAPVQTWLGGVQVMDGGELTDVTTPPGRSL